MLLIVDLCYTVPNVLFLLLKLMTIKSQPIIDIKLILSSTDSNNSIVTTATDIITSSDCFKNNKRFRLHPYFVISAKPVSIKKDILGDAEITTLKSIESSFKNWVSSIDVFKNENMDPKAPSVDVQVIYILFIIFFYDYIEKFMHTNYNGKSIGVIL